MPCSSQQACAFDLHGLVLRVLAIPMLGLRAHRSLHSPLNEVHSVERVDGERRVENGTVELAVGLLYAIILRFPEIISQGFQAIYKGNVQ